jgi:hypothetical protein
MVIAAIKLKVKPQMNKYTKKDVILDINPTKVIDEINMGSDLKRFGYWSDRFVTYLVTTPTNNFKEIEEMFFVYHLLYKACPDLLKVFWFKKDESFIVSYPYMNDENDSENFINIKSELTRVTQFLLLQNYKEEDVISKIRDYKKLLINIYKED